MDDKLDTYLEHFGVKGMSWGKRKPENRERIANQKQENRRNNSSNSTSTTVATKAPRQKMSKEKKVAIAAGVGVVAAIGVGLALKSMNKNMDLPIGQIARSAAAARGRTTVNNVVNRPAPTPSRSPAAGSGLNLGRPSVNTGRPAPTPNSAPRSSTAPSSARSPQTSSSVGSTTLGDLSSIINGGPQVRFNPSTGQYETR